MALKIKLTEDLLNSIVESVLTEYSRIHDDKGERYIELLSGLNYDGSVVPDEFPDCRIEYTYIYEVGESSTWDYPGSPDEFHMIKPKVTPIESGFDDMQPIVQEWVNDNWGNISNFYYESELEAVRDSLYESKSGGKNVKKKLSEVRGESMSQESNDFLLHIRSYLKKLYGNDKNLIDNKINAYIQFIERNNLKDAKELFDDFKNKNSQRSTSKVNNFFGRPQEWIDKQQSEFDREMARRKNMSNKLNTYIESRKLDLNIKHLIREYYLIKEDLESSMSDVFEKTFYKVLLSTDYDIDVLYFGDDLTKAKREFNNPHDESYRDFNRTIILEKYKKYYKFVGTIGEGETIEDEYPVDEWYDDVTVYKLVKEDDEPEIIDEYSESAYNQASDELLSDVQSYFYAKYGRMKYNDIPVYSNDGDYLGNIKLRITDHTENIFNNDRNGGFDYFISVVIANDDKTKNRFSQQNAFERRNNEYHLDFDSDDSFEEVTEQIDELISELAEKIGDK